MLLMLKFKRKVNVAECKYKIVKSFLELPRGFLSLSPSHITLILHSTRLYYVLCITSKIGRF